ncbi:MAG: copper amine oxidase [Negativicutes bacterium]|nr:copper amine oxidase [Negativicutes bacterium]
MKFAVKLFLAVLLVLGRLNQIPAVEAAGPEMLDVDNLPEWRVANSTYGGKLLLSDSPEMVTADGILYQDQVDGMARLFFYHVNATDTAKRLEVILENRGPEVAHVAVRQHGLGGPGYIWMAVGKDAVTSYLACRQSYQVSVPAKGSMPLAGGIGDTAVLPNMLVNGIFDIVADRPVTVKVLQMPLFADSGEFSRKAPILPPDEPHLRGTFEGANRRLVPLTIFDPEHDSAIAMTLADNQIDPYLVGVDATDNSKVVNYGNYGVVYRIFLPSKKIGQFACYLAPIGGDYAGSIGIKYRNVDQDPVATPPARLSFGGDGASDFALLGIFNAHEPLWLTFSPPGGSNLPVRIVVLPQ